MPVLNGKFADFRGFGFVDGGGDIVRAPARIFFP
jgi:hypothetical protein